MNTDADQQGRIPVHVAVVMDGNGRWAQKKHMPRTAGHKAGVGATRQLVENCAHAGVRVLTIFAFSSENWSRPKSEVSSLMSLFVSTITSEVRKLHDKNVRVQFIGDRTRFPQKLQASINDAEQLTAGNKGLVLNVAANYGGRWDICKACESLITDDNGDRSPPDETRLADHLSLSGLPDPDLFIRTGGEHRISNFLIWQLAYTELYFTDVLWPDFDKGALQAAFDWYAGRLRRFGKTSEQIQDTVSN